VNLTFGDAMRGIPLVDVSRLGRAARKAAAMAVTVRRMSAGRESARLIVLRGNSGSGKSTVAAEIRARHGEGIALISQDNLRRVVLNERDVSGGANIGLIHEVARYSLDRGFHVIIDGILRSDHYAAMLDMLRRDHRGVSLFYYLDVPFAETLRRHATRPQAAEFGEAEMRRWYRERDLLPGRVEEVIAHSSSLERTVRKVMNEAGMRCTGRPPKTGQQARRPPSSAMSAGISPPSRSREVRWSPAMARPF
jgi:predicted kinase